jgi:hypothetical protein
VLFGKHGFIVHNLPLLLCLPALTVLWRPSRYRAETVAGLLWCGLTWGLYALSSNNYSGACTSVRWFVPFLAPGFWLLAVVLRDRPRQRAGFLALSAWGVVLAGLMWWKGPWTMRMVPLMWPVVGSALLTWGIVAARRNQQAAVVSTLPLKRHEPRPIAA